LPPSVRLQLLEIVLPKSSLDISQGQMRLVLGIGGMGRDTVDDVLVHPIEILGLNVDQKDVSLTTIWEHTILTKLESDRVVTLQGLTYLG
jgi:ABC-type uncharacterized transport system ATPase subunit